MKTKAAIISLSLVFIFSCLSLYAMDADLWNLPLPPNSQMVRKDKPVEINGVNARGTHLCCNLKVKEITDFYEGVLLRAGWQIEYRSEIQNLVSFIKEGKYMYVGVQENGRDMPSDVYLVSSPSDLAICRMLASMMQEGILEGDVKGKDIPEIPRYPLSKRMVSVFAPEAGAITIYQSQDNPKDIGQFYRQNLKSSGWRLIQDFNSALVRRMLPAEANLNMAMMVFAKDNDTLVINANPIKSEKVKPHSVITIVKNMSQDLGFFAREKE